MKRRDVPVGETWDLLRAFAEERLMWEELEKTKEAVIPKVNLTFRTAKIYDSDWNLYEPTEAGRSCRAACLLLSPFVRLYWQESAPKNKKL